MLPLLDALRAGEVPVQTLGVALQAWLTTSKKTLNALDPDHIADMLLLEDTRAFFLQAYGEDYRTWVPDPDEYDEEQGRNAEPGSEDENE